MHQRVISIVNDISHVKIMVKTEMLHKGSAYKVMPHVPVKMWDNMANATTPRVRPPLGLPVNMTRLAKGSSPTWIFLQFE